MAAPMMAYQKGTSIRNDTGPHDPRDKNQTKIPNTHHPQQRFREISRYDSNHFLGNQQARIAFLGAPHQIAAESRQPERKPTARPGLSGKRTSREGPPIAPCQRSIGREPGRNSGISGGSAGRTCRAGRSGPPPNRRANRRRNLQAPAVGGALSGGRG